MIVHQHTFRAIGCTNSVLTTDATTLDAASAVAGAMVEELDLVASRFRADSEISRITTAAHDADAERHRGQGARRDVRRRLAHRQRLRR